MTSDNTNSFSFLGVQLSIILVVIAMNKVRFFPLNVNALLMFDDCLLFDGSVGVMGCKFIKITLLGVQIPKVGRYKYYSTQIQQQKITLKGAGYSYITRPPHPQCSVIANNRNPIFAHSYNLHQILLQIMKTR